MGARSEDKLLRYIQALQGNIFSWQLCCIFCILTNVHGPADSLS